MLKKVEGYVICRLGMMMLWCMKMQASRELRRAEVYVSDRQIWNDDDFCAE